MAVDARQQSLERSAEGQSRLTWQTLTFAAPVGLLLIYLPRALPFWLITSITITPLSSSLCSQRARREMGAEDIEQVATAWARVRR